LVWILFWAGLVALVWATTQAVHAITRTPDLRAAHRIVVTILWLMKSLPDHQFQIRTIVSFKDKALAQVFLLPCRSRLLIFGGPVIRSRCDEHIGMMGQTNLKGVQSWLSGARGEGEDVAVAKVID
jgi:hypothetical protein